MFSNEQLRNFGRFKQPYDRAARIGELVGQAGMQRQLENADMRAQIGSAIESFGEAGFRRHCRVVGYAAGILTIGVDDPGMVYSYRRSHLFLLRDHLQQVLPQVRVDDIKFQPI